MGNIRVTCTSKFLGVCLCTLSGSDERVYIASQFLAVGALIMALVTLFLTPQGLLMRVLMSFQQSDN